MAIMVNVNIVSIDICYNDMAIMDQVDIISQKTGHNVLAIMVDDNMGNLDICCNDMATVDNVDMVSLESRHLSSFYGHHR